ncbi:MAG: dTDP-4-dehydrorhamnose reductase [Myxococcota bacterium]
MSAATPRVLVLGPDGMLGQAWLGLLQREGLTHDVRSYPDFDLTQRAHVDALPIEGFDVVVNCTGYTNVDGAEEHEDEATVLNGHGVGWLAERCRAMDATLVHYSTDYVFEGDATSPYAVDHPRAPLNAYGRSKAVGEEAIEQSGVRFLLLRTSWLYAPWANNFVRTMARLGKTKESLSVVDDQRGRPTSAEHLASASLALLRQQAHGTLHVTDGGECTWYGLAKAVIEQVNPACVVSPCTTADFPRPAKRPAYSVLDLAPTEALLGPMPAWEEQVAEVVRRLPADG